MEITVKTTKTLEIQELFEIPLDVLVTNQALSGGNLMWMDGVLISFAGFTDSPEMTLKQVEGSYHWVTLEYTLEMKEYVPSLKAEKLNHQVTVYNMSYNPFYKELANFIKNYKNKATK